MSQLIAVLQHAWSAQQVKRLLDDAAWFEARAHEHSATIEGDIAFRLMNKAKNKAQALIERIR